MDQIDVDDRKGGTDKPDQADLSALIAALKIELDETIKDAVHLLLD